MILVHCVSKFGFKVFSIEGIISVMLTRVHCPHSLELTAFRESNVWSDILIPGMGVSQPLGGSDVILTRDMASQKSV